MFINLKRNKFFKRFFTRTKYIVVFVFVIIIATSVSFATTVNSESEYVQGSLANLPTNEIALVINTQSDDSTPAFIRSTSEYSFTCAINPDNQLPLTGGRGVTMPVFVGSVITIIGLAASGYMVFAKEKNATAGIGK